MGQGQLGGLAHVGRRDFGAAGQGGQREGGFVEHDIGAQAGHAQLGAQLADEREQAVGHLHGGEQLAGRAQLLLQGLLRRLPLRPERHRVALEGDAPPHDFRALGHFARGRYVHHQPEAVQKLRAQAALLRVHGADEREARRVAHREPFALHGTHAHCRRVEQHVHEVVGQQVHLINVEHPAVSGCQQAGL